MKERPAFPPGILNKIALLLLFLLATQLHAADIALAVNFDQVAKAEVPSGAAGINLCWLLDSDSHHEGAKPMSQALTDMGVGILRFPYGHLADNYLWDSPPDNTMGKLHPKVASMSQPPAHWTWAVKPDGSMPCAMDFDEYMALCQKIGAKPLVCINVLSFKYPRGPTYQQLKTSAVAWVKYAKQRHYRVAYWEIGNEVDHKENRKLLSMEEYLALYADFAGAMKAEDATAQIGPGILSNPAYDRAIAKKCPDLINFVAVHQYVGSWKNTCQNYAGWRDCQDSFVKNVEQAAEALKDAGLPHVKLLVTETGVSGSPTLGQTNNAYKALWCFEVLMNEISNPQVDYSFYWGTHSPWTFEGYATEPKHDVDVALRLQTNERTPTGEILHLINKNLLDEFVGTQRVIGRVRCYAMRSRDGRQRALFLLNKDNETAPVKMAFKEVPSAGEVRQVQFTGQSPWDVSPSTRETSGPSIQRGLMQTTLPPVSLTILRWSISEKIIGRKFGSSSPASSSPARGQTQRES